MAVADETVVSGVGPDGLLIFDGDCGFCTSSAALATRLLPASVAVQPWQALDLAALGLTDADTTSAAYFVDPDGSLHRAHRAVGRVLEQAGGVMQPLGWVISRPPIGWLAGLAYRLVARYRYKLPGSTDACRVR